MAHETETNKTVKLSKLECTQKSAHIHLSVHNAKTRPKNWNCS